MEIEELTQERDKLLEMHKRNIADCKKFIREREAHHCGWRVTVEGILDRSERIVKQVEKEK